MDLVQILTCTKCLVKARKCKEYAWSDTDAFKVLLGQSSPADAILMHVFMASTLGPFPKLQGHQILLHRARPCSPDCPLCYVYLHYVHPKVLKCDILLLLWC